MATNKRKKAIAAAVAAAAILLAGTFAWTSISQIALNESAGIVNVGGRLHDDFNGENKDIYVENFTDPLDGGQPIYARVRLDEYMEVGQDAGGYGEDVDGDGIIEAQPVVAGTDVKDVNTWTRHIPADVCTQCQTGETCKIHTHWTWEMGGQTTYMPTFNKDKDSLKAEINGTYEGTTKGDTVYYDDYVAYTEGETLEGEASYDDDTNTTDDGVVWTQNEEHTAKKTAEGSVIMMADWDGTAGNYWVYDTDGWAYWANPIMPGEATGLFLSKIDMTKNPGEKCYYGINVVGQFATVGDWEYFEEGGDPTPEALEVLAAASSNVPTVTVGVDANAKTTDLSVGDTVQFNATVTRGDQTVTDPAAFNWSLVDKDGNESQNSTIENGLLTVGKEDSREWYVVAEYKEVPGAVGLNAVLIKLSPSNVTITNETPDVIVEWDRQIQFSAQLTDAEGNVIEDEDITWSIASSSTPESGSTINQDGLVTIGNEGHLEDKTVTVTAAWAKDDTVSSTYTLNVVVPETKISVPDDRYYFDPGEEVQVEVQLPYHLAQNGWEYVLSGNPTDPDTAIDENGILTIGENEPTGTVLTIRIKPNGPYTVTENVQIEVGIPVIEIVAQNGISSGEATAWSAVGGNMVFDAYIYRDKTKTERIALTCENSLDNSTFDAMVFKIHTPPDEVGHITYWVRAIDVISTIDNPEKYTLTLSLENDPNVKASFNWGWYAAGEKE